MTLLTEVPTKLASITWGPNWPSTLPTGGSNWPPWWSQNITLQTGGSNWPALIQKRYVTDRGIQLTCFDPKQTRTVLRVVETPGTDGQSKPLILGREEKCRRKKSKKIEVKLLGLQWRKKAANRKMFGKIRYFTNGGRRAGLGLSYQEIIECRYIGLFSISKSISYRTSNIEYLDMPLFCLFPPKFQKFSGNPKILRKFRKFSKNSENSENPWTKVLNNNNNNNAENSENSKNSENSPNIP